MEEQLNRFLQIFLLALKNVEQSYYETVYRSVEAIRMAFSIHNRARFIDGDFYKPGERIFSYELYHQLRIQIDLERQNNENFLPDTLLQAEVQKFQVFELLERFGISALSRNFVPDLLMHSPGNADSHPYVIEIKADNALEYRRLYADISKLVEFLTRYQYQRGIFLSVTTENEYLHNTISNCQILREIPEINQVSNRIFIINKRSAAEPESCTTLNTIIQDV